MFRQTIANVHLSLIRHNARVLKNMLKANQFFCPMVKANAYGHGDIEITRALVDEGVTSVGVALIEEGIRIRDAQMNGLEILVFNPNLSLAGVRAFYQYNLTPVLSSWGELQLFEKLQHEKPLNVHVKFNTGMTRLGFDVKEAPALRDYFSRNQKLILRGVCTHFLAAEDLFAKRSRSLMQLEPFLKLKKLFQNFKIDWHLLNSSAMVALFCHESHMLQEWGARPGIALYGVKPEVYLKDKAARKKWGQIDLKPALELKSKVILQQEISVGETVSYGGLFKAKKKMAIGVVPIGYADGYMRNFSNKSQMILGEKKVNVTGIVCMDYTMIQLPDKFRESKNKNGRNTSVDEEVIILGQKNKLSITAGELAKIAKTNAYEVLTQLSARVPRVYL